MILLASAAQEGGEAEKAEECGRGFWEWSDGELKSSDGKAAIAAGDPVIVASSDGDSGDTADGDEFRCRIE